MHSYFIFGISTTPPKEMAMLSLANMIVVVLFYFRLKPGKEWLFAKLLLLTVITQLIGLLLWLGFTYWQLHQHPSIFKEIGLSFWDTTQFLLLFFPLSVTCVSWGVKKLFFN